MFQNLTPTLPSLTAPPSLTGLRAFEAMARLGGATRAAAELNVTHSAVSRQVKALERSLGVRLFEGPRSKLVLTAEGRTLAAGLAVGFQALGDAVRAVRPTPGVRIAVHASLAVKWLIPRLADLEARHPGLVIELSDLPVEAVKARDADLVLRLLDGPSLDDPAVTVLGESRIGLVASPSRLGEIDALPRLASSSHRRGWDDWTAATGRAPPTGPLRTLSHLHYILDGALSGMGAAVLPWILVDDAIHDGRLIAPFGFVGDGGKIVAVTMDSQPTQAVRRTIAWLQDQVAITLDAAPD